VRRLVPVWSLSRGVSIWWYLHVAGWCPLGGLCHVCSGVLSPCGGPQVGIFL